MLCKTRFVIHGLYPHTSKHARRRQNFCTVPKYEPDIDVQKPTLPQIALQKVYAAGVQRSQRKSQGLKRQLSYKQFCNTDKENI